jgi:hypothetical protein
LNSRVNFRLSMTHLQLHQNTLTRCLRNRVQASWVIPAGRYERRYAALAVSPIKRGDKSYFKALHKQIAEGGAEAMLYDLQRMDLGDWHPRDIPHALLCNPALQKQQGFTLPPIEQWYVSLLHDGVLPGSLANKPNTAYTKSLLDDDPDRAGAFALPVIGGRLVNEITVANVDECRSGAPDVTDACKPDQPRVVSSEAMTVATLFHHHQCH